MANSGLTSLKDQAVNMNRGPQGLEPYVQYMEAGGVVDRVLTYFGYGDEPPTETRNIFEEQREVAEKERFRPTVEEGIARAEEGRYQDERLARYDQEGPLMRMIAARIRKKKDQPFTPFEKNLGLQDDPYAKKPPVPSTYQTGVEFGDTEVGFDLLGQLDFNKVLLAGLRDNRTLSDFVKTPKRDDDDSYKALQMSKAYYQGKDNIIQMSPLSMEDNFNSTLTHELMHKGADLLQKASGKDLEKLRKNVMSKGRMSQAEHRYIQSIVNKAYVDRMLLNESVFSRSQLADYEAYAKKRPNDSFYKKQIKNYKKDLQGDRNQTLLSEAKRVFDLYMTKENREKFISRVTPFLEENKISSFFLTKDYDYNKIADIFDIMPFRDSMAIFDTANSIMAEDHITQKFAETMKNAKSSRLTKDYDSYFPEQIPPNFDLYTPPAKAEGGVIGLKDRAVKMFENGGEAQIEETMPPELQKAYNELSQELIQDPRTGDFRYRTDEEIIKILSQFQSQDFLQDVASGGFEIRPSVQGKGSVTNKKSFIGTLDGEPMYKDIRVNQGSGRLGFDAVAPNKDQFGAGVSVYGSKGRAKAPEVLQQFGVDRVKKFGSNKVNVGGLDAYYRMMNALNKGDSVTAGVNYNPNSEETNYNVNYNVPVKDLGIPALRQGAVNMYRRMIR